MHLPAYDRTHLPRVRPTTDILERPDGVLVLVNMPGVSRDALTVMAHRRELFIRGLSGCGCTGRRPDAEHGGETILALEFVDVEYELRIALSDAQDSENVRATLKNGVLSVFLPRGRTSGPRSIPIEIEAD